MTFEQEVYLRLIDTGLLGLLIAIAGYWLNRLLEQFKHQQAQALETFKGHQERENEIFKTKLQQEFQSTTQIALSQLPAYRTLWELTEPVSPAVTTPLTPELKSTLEADLRRWYYQQGNGVFLSLKAGRLFLRAKNLLTKERETNDEAIRAAFSDLRTQLKTDIGVYGPGDAEVDIST